MKKMYFMLISVIVCAFLSVGCGQTGTSDLDTGKAVSENSTSVGFTNDNDQGEDEGNGKKPPIVIPPEIEPPKEQEEQPPIDDIVKPVIKYLRCSDYLRTSFTSDMYPPRFIFKSVTEFEDCIAPLVESKYAYTYHDYLPKTFQLAPAVNDYNDAFFKDYNLVMVLLIENSGGNRHEVEIVDVKSNELNILIKRNPGGMTADMAYWYIFIPIKKNNFDGDIVNIEIVNTP